MHRISSNTTLFLKIFLPTFWIAFFGILTAAIALSNVEQFNLFNFTYMKIGMVAFFILGTVLLYFSLMQLKRVELDKDFVYASNYFKTYRYPYHNVESMAERDFWLFTLVKIQLKTPGNFGKVLTFLLDEAMLTDFLEKNPEMAGTLDGLKN